MNKYIQFIIEADKNRIINELLIDYISDINLEKYVLHIVNFFSEWTAFVDDSNRVSIFNTEPIFYSNDVCKSIDKVLEYSLKCNKIEEVQVLSYILYCFHYSYDKGNKYENKRLDEYKNQFYVNFSKKEFYSNGAILKNTIDFMKNYIDYIIDNYDEDTLYYKIYNELSFLLNVLSANSHKELQLYVNKLIKFDDYNIMIYLIKFDKNTSINKDVYLNKELSYFKDVYEKTEFCLIKELYKQKLINECDEKNILDYIINKLVNIEFEEKYEVEYITNNVIDMCNIIIELKEVLPKFKNELKQVKLDVEQIARENIIQPNKNYSDKRVKIHSTNFNEVLLEFTDDIKNEFMMCNFNIELFFLKALAIQYDNILESIVKDVINDPLSLFVQTKHYDTYNMLVKKNKDKYTENIIRKYYSNKMNTIYDTKFAKELNSHIYNRDKGYKYLIDKNKKTNEVAMLIIDKVFKEFNIKFIDIKKIIESLGIFKEDSLNNIQDNCQIIVMKIIISIESALLTTYNKTFGTKLDNFSEKVIFELFNKFIYNNEFKNSLTYIYISIYDNMGLNIRNLYAHGNRVSSINIWNDILVAITCFRHLTHICLPNANVDSFTIRYSIPAEAECDKLILIEEFNKMNAIFGYIPIHLFEKDSTNDLYYFYPMIERLFRFILHEHGGFDIENKASQTYRTLFSIIDSNRDRLVDTFDDELLYYLEDTYKEDGVRNKVMHFNEKLVLNMEYVYSAKYIFIRLVEIYVDLKRGEA